MCQELCPVWGVKMTKYDTCSRDTCCLVGGTHTTGVLWVDIRWNVVNPVTRVWMRGKGNRGHHPPLPRLPPSSAQGFRWGKAKATCVFKDKQELARWRVGKEGEGRIWDGKKMNIWSLFLDVVKESMERLVLVINRLLIQQNVAEISLFFFFKRFYAHTVHTRLPSLCLHRCWRQWFSQAYGMFWAFQVAR